MARTQAQIESAKKNLIPLNKRSKKEHREITSKGGKVTAQDSIRIAIANKLRGMKQRNNWSEDDLSWFQLTLINPEANMAKMEEVLNEGLKEGKMSVSRYVELSDRLHRSRFGEKTTNTNINVNVSAEEFDKRMFGEE